MDFFEGEGVAAKAKDPVKTVKKLIVYLSPHKMALITVFIFAVISTVFAVIGPRVMGRVTTLLVDGLLAYWFDTGLLTDFRQM
jgi:ATP-binding cassette subfamily B protein